MLKCKTDKNLCPLFRSYTTDECGCFKNYYIGDKSKNRYNIMSLCQTSKTQAMLNIKHEDKFIRKICKYELKDEPYCIYIDIIVSRGK